VVQHTYKLHKQKKAENSSKHDRYRNNIDIITTTCELYRQGILKCIDLCDDETIPKQDTQFATPRKRKEKKKKMEKEEYHVYCDKDGPEIDVQETKFWKKKIRKYLKPLEQDKNRK
jgi:hypothetical protein